MTTPYQQAKNDLFESDCPETGEQQLGEAATVLRGFVMGNDHALFEAIQQVAMSNPFRHMATRGGHTMSAAMTNCGESGWVSDAAGYRYDACDPLTNQSWPSMPDILRTFATSAADVAGFPGFYPDVCLINRYRPGARMSLHQDRDEADFANPIVSLSLGIPAVFLWGGHKRRERPQRIPLFHGDTVVWGSVDRLRYHGIAPIKEASHPVTGAIRFNLTFRRAR